MTATMTTAIGRGVKIESPRKRALRRFLRHRLALVGIATLVIIVLLAIFGSEERAYQQNLKMGWTNQPPGWIH